MSTYKNIYIIQGLDVVARTEAPNRRRGRARLRIVYRNIDPTKHVRFKLDPETAYLYHVMRTEREEAENAQRGRAS